MSSPSSDAPDLPQSIYGSRKASLPLDVIVVGCGIGGLSAAFCLTQAGHSVTIVESSPVIGPNVGAGILCTPNCSRLLRRWGLGTRLDELAVTGKGAILRRYNTGEQIGFTEWEETMKVYGAPYYQLHRADLHKTLYDLIVPHVTILSGSPVVGCDPNPVAPSVTLESGKVLNADLIVGADGLKSYIQEVVLGKPNKADETGDAAYRTLVPASLMMQDPELRELIENPYLTSWFAPGRSLVAYPIVSIPFPRF
jgi:salicylate hydroxylase